jgi:hypothetical protein
VAGRLGFAIASREAQGPNKPPIKLVRGILTGKIKRLGCEADHVSQESTDNKIRGPTPPLIQ